VNQIITNYYPMFKLYQSLRGQLMDLIADDDLGFTPGGSNMTLGELCREIGETERAYIESFKTFTQSFDYRNTTPGLAESVDQLKAWYAELDQELAATIEGLSEDDIANRVIDRGHDFKLPPQANLDVYKEALLLFYGKATVYLRALNKSLPEQWKDWIG
jgi:uncharacterized damage-inducible protein DinB